MSAGLNRRHALAYALNLHLLSVSAQDPSLRFQKVSARALGISARPSLFMAR